MPNAAETQSTHIRTLDAEDATRILARALVQRVPARIESTEHTLGQFWSGTVTGGGDGTIVIDVTPGSWPLETLETMDKLRCHLQIQDLEYHFTSWLARDACRFEQGVVAILIPTTLTIEERRRSPRRALAQATEVALVRPDDAGATLRGKLLNVSNDGLACLVARTQAEELHIGNQVIASFRVGGSDTSITLHAEVVNITSGSDPTLFVLGMEYVDDMDSPNRKQLACALKQHAAKGPR